MATHSSILALRIRKSWTWLKQLSTTQHTVSRSRKVFEVRFGKSLGYLEETLLVELMQVKRWLWWDLRNEEHAIGNWRKGDPIYKVAEKVKLFPSVLWKVEIKSNKLWYLAAEISEQCLWCSQISSYSLEYTGGEREIKGVVKQKWTRIWRFGKFLAYLQYGNLQEKCIGDHFVICLNVKSLCCKPETNMIMYINYTSVLKKEIHIWSFRQLKYISHIYLVFIQGSWHSSQNPWNVLRDESNRNFCCSVQSLFLSSWNHFQSHKGEIGILLFKCLC